MNIYAADTWCEACAWDTSQVKQNHGARTTYSTKLKKHYSTTQTSWRFLDGNL